jgi:hypothetical protein
MMIQKEPASKTMPPAVGGLRWKCAFMLVALISCLLWQGHAMAQLSATLTANPVVYKGSCPNTIAFTGVITSAKVQHVTYVFIRSDGAIDTNAKTLDFTQPGSLNVTTTWTLGGNTLPKYQGWEAIKIIHPKTVKSNEAKFEVQCTPSVTVDNICVQHPEVCKGLCTAPNCPLSNPLRVYCAADGCPVCPESCIVSLTLEDIDPEAWNVQILDPAGSPVAAQQFREASAISLSFQPSANFAYALDRYQVVIQGTRRGARLDMKPRLAIKHGVPIPLPCPILSARISKLLGEILSATNLQTKAALERDLEQEQILFDKTCGSGQGTIPTVATPQ